MNTETGMAAKTPTQPARQRRGGVFAAAVAGVLAAGVTLGVGQLVAALIDPNAAPFYAVGATIIDHTPQSMRELIIRQFGTNDKLVLFLSMGAVIVILAAVAGIIDRRHPFGSMLFVGFGVAVAGAAVQRPTATVWFVLPTVVGVAAGVAALRTLIRATPRRAPSDPGTARSPSQVGASRRHFLVLSLTAGAVAVAATTAGRYLGEKLRAVTADRNRFLVPTPAVRAAPVPTGTDLAIADLTSFVTGNDAFYRVDTALVVPAITTDAWQLRIHGMVEHEMRLSFDDLRRRTAVEKMITLTCVSNEIGGTLAGNATWTGYPLADLLAEAGVHPDSDMLLSRSTDGFTAGTPVAALTDGRDALLAVAMNGQPLPLEHGYPARLVVPGLYGYVSATKWVIDLELTRFDRAKAYWSTRGWAEQAPIKTASRIDVPAAFATLAPGPVIVAGVAWAQHRGIRSVEVRVDRGPWQPATLAAEYSIDTWRQWRWNWDATPGYHTLVVRATDATGTLQTEQVVTPIPDGASGWTSRVVIIS